jgi:hypothetical protein
VGAATDSAIDGVLIPIVDVQLLRPTTVERLDLPGAPPGRFVVSVNEPGIAARALGVAARRQAWLSRRPGPPVVPEGIDVHAARRVVTTALSRAPAGDWLLPPEVEALCLAAAIPAAPLVWVTTAKEAVAAVARARGPVALKGVVTGIVHKGDAGLLRLPVTDEAEAGRVVEEWADRAGSSWIGAVVQPMVAPGDEFLVGAIRDPSAGPVVALGPGGRATDALGHRMHRLAPPTDADVDEMLAGTELIGTGHGRSLDLAGIGDCVRRVGWLADALPEMAEIEVNPLVVTSGAWHWTSGSGSSRLGRDEGGRTVMRPGGAWRGGAGAIWLPGAVVASLLLVAGVYLPGLSDLLLVGPSCRRTPAMTSGGPAP